MSTQKTTVIMTSGYAGSGKDTLGHIMASAFGFKRIAFADKLKDIVSEQWNLDRSKLDSHVFKKMPLLHLPVSGKDALSKAIFDQVIERFSTQDGTSYKRGGANQLKWTDNGYWEVDGKKLYWTPRALMIAEGCQKRSVDPDYWVKQAISGAPKDQFGQLPMMIVITDWRFDEHLATAEMLPYHKLITVRIDSKVEPVSQDSSERYLDNYKFDARVWNDLTSLDNFEKEIREKLGPFI